MCENRAHGKIVMNRVSWEQQERNNWAFFPTPLTPPTLIEETERRSEQGAEGIAVEAGCGPRALTIHVLIWV
jgi:hypothetical protein